MEDQNIMTDLCYEDYEENEIALYEINLKKTKITEPKYNGYNYDKLTSLWKLVIIKALLDATYVSHAEKNYRNHSSNAKAWIFSNRKDFQLVCVMANLEPDYVRKIAKEAIKNPKKWHEDAIFRWRLYCSDAGN